MFYCLVTAFLLVTFEHSKAFIEREICVDELGCFGNLGPFYNVLWRPFALLPSVEPSAFRLYTRDNRIAPQLLLIRNGTDLNSTHFDPKIETKIIVHGFTEGQDDWMIEMKNIFLTRQPVNVITVDWSQSSGIPYIQAATNTRVVGAEIALLLTKLQNKTGLDLNLVHLIGFSLGAHICGYAGERLNKVRRITALDPAGPMFEDLETEVRLDPTDAQFVDAIHTDGRSLMQLAFGQYAQIGHVDFYPNGGHKQPGCPENILESVSYASIGALLRGLDHAGEEVGCRHSRAKVLFMESLRPKIDCQFVAFPCLDWESFIEGNCTYCGPNGTDCGVMGIQAEEFKPASHTGDQDIFPKMYLYTYPTRPYCKFHYSIKIKIQGTNETEGFFGRFPTGPINVGSPYGQLEMSLAGLDGTSIHTTIGETQVYEPGTEYNFLLLSEHDLGELETVVLHWKPASTAAGLFHLNFRADKQLTIHSVLLIPLKIQSVQRSYLFCAEGRGTMEPGSTLELRTSIGNC